MMSTYQTTNQTIGMEQTVGNNAHSSRGLFGFYVFDKRFGRVIAAAEFSGRHVANFTNANVNRFQIELKEMLKVVSRCLPRRLSTKKCNKT